MRYPSLRSICGSMLLVIGRFGWGELVPLMFDPLASQLAALAPEELDPRLGATLQALRRLDLREPLRRILAGFYSLIDSAAPELAGPRMALAGALSLVDDPRGQAMFEAARARLKHPATVPQRVQLTRELANGYALASIPTAIAGIEKLLVQWKDITDSYGTNTHLCLTALEFADALIFGLTEARLGRGAP